MTVSTQVSRNEYTGNGATTQYDFTFRILDKSHLLVQTLDTSESIVTLTLGTDYTVTGVNRYNGGKVVLTSALPAGYKISIERSTPVTQEASIRNQGGFFPEIHEDAFDKLTMLVQQAYGWWSGLSLRKPSWLTNYYDALNNRIRNLRDPSQAQDAATKNYVDDQISNTNSSWQHGDAVLEQKIDSNFRRALRVPEGDISVLDNVNGRKNKILACNDNGEFIFVTPESGSAADVLISLGANDGVKWIGRCPSIMVLRNTEPSHDGQKIELEAYFGDQNSLGGGGGYLYYDSSDTTSSDNGITIFVTNNGARWRREDSDKKILLEWAGVRDGDDLSDEWQNAIDIVVDIAKKNSTGGKLPVIEIKAGVYQLSKEIHHPPFVRTVFVGDVQINSTMTGFARAINIKSIPGFRPLSGVAQTAIPGKALSGIGGGLDLVGPGRSTNTGTIGIAVGNTVDHYYSKDGTGECPCTIEDVRVTQFGAGIGLTGYDCYLVSFINCKSGLNRTNVRTLDTKYINSGERISFINCLLWGGGEDFGHLYINCPNFDLQFIAGSWDYTAKDFINIGAISGWSTIMCSFLHMEGVENYVVNALSSNSGNVTVKFQDCDMVPTGSYGSAKSNSPSRKLVNLPSSGVSVEMDGMSMRYTRYPTKDNILMSTSDRFRVNSLTRSVYPVIPSPAHIKNRGYDFSGEVDGAVLTESSPLNYFTSSSRVALSATVRKVDSDNTVLSLVRATGATTNSSITLWVKEYMPVDRRRKYTLSCAVQYLNNTTVNVNHYMRWYDKDLNLLSTSTYIYFMTTIINDSAADDYSEGGNRKIPSISTYWNPPAGAAYLMSGVEVSQLTADANISNVTIGEI